MKKTAATALGEIIAERDDFRDAFHLAESTVAQAFLEGKVAATLDEQTVRGLLRYADILSHSEADTHRELAYSVIALLREYDELLGLPAALQTRTLAVSEAVLIQLGNFPGISTLQKEVGSLFTMPLSRGVLRAAKETIQATHHGDKVFTDTQFEIAEGLRSSDYFSFSGPTSLGKSFIIKDALYEIVQRPELDQHCVVLLVPTKALIGQTAADLRELLQDVPDVNVSTFPILPRLIRERYSRSIFVLTPERLLRYLAAPTRDIDYLIVDEAQKVVAENDTRSALYYHAIVETTRRYATKLIFASPSIKNPELFLELFQKASSGAMKVRERTVAQQRYFVDLVDREQYRFSGLSGSAEKMDAAPVAGDELELITTRSQGRKAIVYINSAAKAAEFALRLARSLPKVKSPIVAELSAYVRKFVHKDYFLADCLEHGVAFHHGKMPQEVREKVEECFSAEDSPLQYVVCTSTLLEGVNLPAKNIFVLSDKHGSRNFRKIDFENLVGRAGRLTYDFSGNVICVRHEASRWQATTRELIAKTEPEPVTSFLLPSDRRTRKDYTNIERVLKGQDLPKGTSADALQNVQQYASILMTHHLDQQATPLRTTFLEKIEGASDLLRKAAAAVDVPTDILRRSPNILPVYQDRVWKGLESGQLGPLVSDNADLGSTDTYHDVLRRLSELYNWRVEESRIRDSLVSKNSTADALDRRLRYWAILMRSWIRGLPLSLLIRNSIGYYEDRGVITFPDFDAPTGFRTEPFTSSSKQVNFVIEETLRDIEGGLRFRIIGYLQNYYDLSRRALGADESGHNLANLVEYGTTDARVVELQEIGFSRATAGALVRNYGKLLEFTDHGELFGLQVESLLVALKDEPEARDEVSNIFVKVPAVATA
ncbi:DEAD/DEAH box helicase [Microbacterium aurugineum]|uniref:DEAD/DEAH box helicase n=1 Tax=Microbacterium aurugineum TaxID=2851642 RepID=A0ABY4J0V6_9MICO|nr:DEAD/DEAH box helicase [Microbacterium aurugineum]UPL18645.1 DEAD/DEAH box helicase [Microbacterium aurugineum]